MKLFILLASIFLLTACDKPDDVTRIRTIVEDAVVKTEKQDIRGLMEYVTSDFEANPGRQDEQSVRGILLITLRRFGQFDIKHPVPGIRLSEDASSADVSLPFLVVREGEKFPEIGTVADDPARWVEEVGDAFGDPYRLELEMVKRDDEWKVKSATIQGKRTLGSGGRFP